jgi:hypothetical protein
MTRQFHTSFYSRQFHTSFYSSTMKQDRYLHILHFLHFTDNKNERDMTRKFWQVMDNTKSVWISKQYNIKSLQAFWTSGCSQIYCFVQRKGLFLTIHKETQTINTISNLSNETDYTYGTTIYSFLDGVRKFSIEIFNSPSRKIYWKQRCKSLEWNCTQQRLVCLGPWQWHTKNVMHV